MNIDLATIKRLAIVRLSALGDVVLLLPMVRTLQKILPDLHITWITSPFAYQILDGIEGIEFIVINKPNSLKDYWKLHQQLKHRTFDVLLALQANFRVNLLYPLIKAPLKIGYDVKRARDLQRLFTSQRIAFQKQHLLESFFAFAEALGIHERLLEWRLPISEQDISWAHSQLPHDGKPILAINPMASKLERNWLLERYVQVIKQVKQRWQAHIVLTGGPSDAESELARKIITAAKDNVINLVGKTTPKQLAAVLGEVTCLLAPDTGPAHIAVAMNTPVVGLFAVAPPELSGPYLSQNLVVNCYPQAVREFLGKDPATIPWATRVHDTQAMSLISVEAVIEKLAIVLKAAIKTP